ncbi:hypothetical protein SAMN05421641_1365 [Paracoccus thiocyanatus]|uniref:Uncharacterized protein n=1 Tax=Paracoccus thiocyanatus TaxID=34006 RepID=A0A1N6ZL13_9RHOB|nr:hypothetical protein [Paracoccus thiocyanatus]SIR27572.1 hypothetical protein SAMN05421641_1365 [Paracoccus thiocyanatus]
MKTLVAALLLSCGLLSAGHAQQGSAIDTMPSAQIVEQAGSLHPSALYVLASRLLAEGKGPEAANWMYAGQLRYRFLLAVPKAQADDRILFAALSEQVGRPVNEYIAGDPDEWMAAMRWALDWDAANENHVTSKTRHAAELAEVRGGLDRLIFKVDASRDQIRRDRTANGLENR